MSAGAIASGYGGLGYGDDIKDQPGHWLNVVNLEPTKSNLQQLALELGQRSVAWIDEFIELRGVVTLMDLLELLEKRTCKRVADFEVMEQVLRCLRSLMNLERGMDAILGIEDEVRPRPILGSPTVLFWLPTFSHPHLLETSRLLSPTAHCPLPTAHAGVDAVPPPGERGAPAHAACDVP